MTEMFAKAEMFNQLFADCKWQSFRGVFVDTKCDETNCESPASCSGAGHCTPKGTCACDRGAIGDLCEDCVTGFAGTSCDACAPGFHGLTCQQCPLNTYSAGGAPTDAVCEACAPGTVAPAGSDKCYRCPKGSFRTADDDQCLVCPGSTTTSTNGSTGCYTCTELFYRVPFAVGANVRCDDHSSLYPPYFAKCCSSCGTVTGTRGCAEGTTLESLPIKRNYWRATALETRLYRCFYKKVCEGWGLGSQRDSYGDGLCQEGHEGPLCNVCKRDWFFSYTNLRCEKCGAASPVVFGIVVVVVALLLVAVALTIFYPGIWLSFLFGTVVEAVHPRVHEGKFDEAIVAAVEHVEDEEKDAADEAASRRDADAGAASETEDEEKDLTARFLLTKLKIVISCYQIVGVMILLFPTISWPSAYEKVAQAFGFASLSLSSVTRSACLLPSLDYIDQLIFSTFWPIAVLVLMLVAYNVVSRIRPSSAFADSNKWIYCALLLFFLVFAGNSMYVFRFFKCITFHARGDDPSKIRVLMADMSINCRSDRYQNTKFYVWAMVAVYPIGFPLFCFFTLFRYRRQINPTVEASAEQQELIRGTGFLRLTSTRQMEMGIEERRKNQELQRFRFFFEEYEPRCWWYAVAELTMRLYLTGLLSFFGSSDAPATTTQTSLGLLGAMIYYVVLSAYDPFIDPLDDLLAKVAAFQVMNAHVLRHDAASGGKRKKKNTMPAIPTACGPVLRSRWPASPSASRRWPWPCSSYSRAPGICGTRS